MSSDEHVKVVSKIKIPGWLFPRVVVISKTEGSDGFLLRALKSHREIARLEASIEDDCLVLCWLSVEKTYRKHKLGTVLLRAAISRGRELGIARVVGGVTKDGLQDYPFLLKWYSDEGFDIREGTFRPMVIPCVYTISKTLK